MCVRPCGVPPGGASGRAYSSASSVFTMKRRSSDQKKKPPPFPSEKLSTIRSTTFCVLPSSSGPPVSPHMLAT